MIIDRETCIGCGECVFTCTVCTIGSQGAQRDSGVSQNDGCKTEGRRRGGEMSGEKQAGGEIIAV